MARAIGMKGRGQGVARIATHRMLNSNENKELVLAIQNPIQFSGVPQIQGKLNVGYEATVLYNLCEGWESNP